jgi:poly(A) polymerase
MSAPTILDSEAIARAIADEPPLAALLSTLDRDGEEARIVGGAVRNALIGEAASDVDIATTATPDVVTARAQALGFHVVPTGVEHGTVTVVVRGKPFEVTTLREDVETYGRKARVRFGRDFSADAMRRDFTINALSATRAGRVFDYATGLADLKARRVRFIGDAATRIREDYLRILRFFRFHARYGEGALDAQGFAAAIAERAGLATLSRERVRAETMKLIVAPRALEVLIEADGAGFLLAICGGVANTARLGALLAADRRDNETSEAALRLAALAVLVVEDADRLRERLRLSNDEHLRLSEAARVAAALHGGEAPQGDELLRLLFERGRRAARDGLRLAGIDAPLEMRRGFATALRALDRAEEPALPFKGADLIERGLTSGRIVGETLKRLQAAWIRAGFPRDPGRLGRLLDEAIAQARAGR